MFVLTLLALLCFTLQMRVHISLSLLHVRYLALLKKCVCVCVSVPTWRGGVLGSRPKKMYGERLGDGVEYHLMSPTPRR